MAGICEHIHHLLALAPFAGFSTCRKTITSLSFIDNYYIGTHYETFDDATRDLRHFAYPDRPQLDSRSADLRPAGDQLPGRGMDLASARRRRGRRSRERGRRDARNHGSRHRRHTHRLRGV